MREMGDGAEGAGREILRNRKGKEVGARGETGAMAD
jgi:hypothetical protein